MLYDAESQLVDDDWEDTRCTICGGEGYVECDDWIQCTSRHLTYRHPDTGESVLEERCHACGGTGAAKDQTIW
jgi:hypothetical protein